MGEETGKLTDYGQYNAGDDDSVEEPQQVEEIRADIEQTRSEMGQTIDAIQEKLNPENIIEQAKEKASEAASEAFDNAKQAVRDATIGRVENMVSNVSDTGSGFMDTIKRNPIPAAMAGIGLFWLLRSGGQNKDNSTKHPYQGQYQVYPAYGHGNPNVYDQPYRNTQTTQNTGSNQGIVDKVMGTIKENPIPAAVAGISLGYMVTKGGGQSQAQSYNYRGYQQQQGLGDKVGDVAGTVGDKVGDVAGAVGDTAGNVAQKTGDILGQAGQKVGDVAGGVGDTVGNVAGNVGETFGNVAGNVAGTVQQAPSQIGRMLDENPMAVGAVALAMGMVVGLMLPGTEPENRLMGEARDTLVEKVTDAAQDTIDKVQQVGDKVQETVKQETKNQGLIQ